PEGRGVRQQDQEDLRGRLRPQVDDGARDEPGKLRRGPLEVVQHQEDGTSRRSWASTRAVTFGSSALVSSSRFLRPRRPSRERNAARSRRNTARVVPSWTSNQ